jgi:photosystem II protein
MDVLTCCVLHYFVGDSYKLGAKGLLAWAGLIVVLLGVGINLVISTSAIGQ